MTPLVPLTQHRFWVSTESRSTALTIPAPGAPRRGCHRAPEHPCWLTVTALVWHRGEEALKIKPTALNKFSSLCKVASKRALTHRPRHWRIVIFSTKQMWSVHLEAKRCVWECLLSHRGFLWPTGPSKDSRAAGKARKGTRGEVLRLGTGGTPRWGQQ